VSQNANTKISKAAMLQKAAECIRALKSERQTQQEDYDRFKKQIESLNQTIGVFQSQLPVTGAPIACQRTGQTKELFENYVLQRTQQNWKFWIFSIIMENLLESYDNTIATSSLDEMCKSMMRWLDQSCSLVTLRRDVLNSLRYLSTSTNILTNPASLPEEALEAVSKKKEPNQSSP
jgi:MAX-like protein X